jgi:uncharacterized Zn-binding protein involved in type VI secretion
MRADSGIALVKVLLLTLILFAVAAYAARSTRVEVRVAQNDYLGKRASQIAEAGLRRAWRQIEQDLTNGQNLTQEVNGTASLWSTGSSDSTFSGYRFFSFGGGSTDGYHLYVANNSDDSGGSATDNDKQVLITSIGTVSGSQREIQALLVQLPLFGNGLYGKYVASVSGGGNTNQSTDSYNSNTDPSRTTLLHHGSVGSNGDINLGGNPVAVHGDLTAAGTVTPGTSTVTGTVTSGAPQVAFPPAPSCPFNSYGAQPLNGSISCTSTQGNNTSSCNPFNSSTGTLTGANSQQITLSAGVYCFSSASITGQATITMTGPVTMYLTSTNTPTTFGGGGFVNYTQGGNSYASNLQVFSSYDSGGNTTLTNGLGGLNMMGGSTLYASIYAPEATIVIGGGGNNMFNFIGAAVGGAAILNGNVGFIYDEALQGLTGKVTSLTGWHEVFN